MPGGFQCIRPIAGLFFLSLVLMVVLLAQRLEQARAENALLWEESMKPAPGTFIPPVSAKTLSGSMITLGEPEDSGLQILFFFDTACPYCRESLRMVERLSDRIVDQDALTLVGVCFDSVATTAAFLRSNNTRLSVVSLPDERIQSYFRVRATPVMMVVGDQGRVVWSRAGVVVEEAVVDSLLNAARLHFTSGEEEDPWSEAESG